MLLMQQFERPKGVIWTEKKFRSENYFPIARIGFSGDDAWIMLTQTGKTMGPHRAVYFKIANFRSVAINDVILHVFDNYKGDGCYPLGRNFEDALMELHSYGMRINRSVFS